MEGKFFEGGTAGADPGLEARIEPTYEPYLSPAKLARMFPGAHCSDEIRRMCVRANSPIPHIKLGEKRKRVGVRASTYVLFLQWEEGLIPYGKVVEGSRRFAQEVR